ncbi:MAG: VWA domain-containing protein [Sedimentisphaerales bacterium]|nr:VWA domain-containing protein [Sedimentisphaerales bacterium]
MSARRLETAVSWTVSLVLHCTVLVAFMLITRPASTGGGPGQAEVGIYLGPQGMEPQAPPAPLLAETVDASEVSLASLSIDSLENRQITDLAIPTERPQPLAESLIGVDGPAQGTAETMTDAWNGFLAGGGADGAGTTSFFGLRARGTKFIYVVDCSGSMQGAKLRAAKAELYRSVQALPAHTQFFILFYNHSFSAMPAENLVRSTDAQKAQAFQWVEQIGSSGGTDPTGAMLKALSLEPDAIWLLSDGLFHDQACTVIQQANPQAKVQIHTIAFHDNQGERQLMRIAEENRGHYRFVPGAAPIRRRP